MVEVVARAMCLTWNINCHDPRCPHVKKCVGDMNPKDALMIDARAAIKAMRDPTPRMIRAGATKPELPPERPGTADCDVNVFAPTAESGTPNGWATTARYQAMIDAALEE